MRIGIFSIMCHLSLGLQKKSLLSKKTPYFRKHLYAKRELITRARLRAQDFGTSKNFCFNQCHNKEFLSFFLDKIIL